MNTHEQCLALILTIALAGCATELAPEAQKIRTVTADQKSSCASLGVVTADQQLGPYKAKNSMNQVLNEVARRGGNAMYLISQQPSGFDGVSVTAEAMRCK
jgi:hypothetical protein